MKVLAAVILPSPSTGLLPWYTLRVLPWGIVRVIFAMTGIMTFIARITPLSVACGIQAALGVLLAVQAYKMLAAGWVLGIVAVAIVVLLLG